MMEIAAEAEAASRRRFQNNRKHDLTVSGLPGSGEFGGWGYPEILPQRKHAKKHENKEPPSIASALCVAYIESL